MLQRLAQPIGPGSTINLNPPPGSGFENLVQIDPASFVAVAVQLILVITVIVFFFMLVLGGLRWITSGGDKGATEGAKAQITSSLVGLLIVFATWAIIQIIEALFGIDILGGLDLSFLNP